MCPSSVFSANNARQHPKPTTYQHLKTTQAGIERLTQYMTRCPFSLSRLVKVTQGGTVLYKAEKHACRAFPLLAGDGLKAGAKRNPWNLLGTLNLSKGYQVLSPLDFLAEFTQHPPSPRLRRGTIPMPWLEERSRGAKA